MSDIRKEYERWVILAKEDPDLVKELKDIEMMKRKLKMLFIVI